MHLGRPRGEGQQKKPSIEPGFETSRRPQSSIRYPPSAPGIWESLKRGFLRVVEFVLLEPPSQAQTEQLARKILDYGVINRRGCEPMVLQVPEMAARFREPRRNVRLSLELLEEQGTVERTQFKDHWKLTGGEPAPMRDTDTPPEFSASSPKVPPSPPPGWSELQNRAQQAKNVEEFNAIMDEMNRLLATQENAASQGKSPVELPDRKLNQKGASSGRQE